MNEETGVEEVLYSQAELDAMKAEADAKIAATEKAAADKAAADEAHYKGKIDEFTRGKTSQEQKDAERDAKIAEAKAVADAANARSVEAEQKRLDAIKAIARSQYVGDNAELIAKFEESWPLISLEIKSDEDIAKKAGMVASLIGVNNQSPYGGAGGGMPMSGGSGFAPAPSTAKKAALEAEHQNFMDALPGMNDFIPKPEETK